MGFKFAHLIALLRGVSRIFLGGWWNHGHFWIIFKSKTMGAWPLTPPLNTSLALLSSLFRNELKWVGIEKF